MPPPALMKPKLPDKFCSVNPCTTFEAWAPATLNVWVVAVSGDGSVIKSP